MNTLFRICLGLSVALVLSSSSCKKDTTTTTIITHDTIYEGTVVDRQGTQYKTITLGKQTWMAENLKATVYNDSTPIVNEKDPVAWLDLSSGAYCNYNNIDSLGVKYGRLYNWYAVETAKLCPEGWHVPSDADWDSLVVYLVYQNYDYLNYGTVAVSQAMASNVGWATSTTEGAPGYSLSSNNECKFSAYPSGYMNGSFHGLSFLAKWWSSTQDSDDTSNASNMSMDNNLVYPSERNVPKILGHSVRCIKD